MMQSLRARRATRGFTLVELMVTMAVAAILMAGVYQFFIAQQRSYSNQDEVNRVQQNARMAETLIAKAIQLTGSFLPDPLNAATISMRDQSILAATDRYIVLQYDDPLNTADLHVVAADEVVAFVVSKTVPVAGTAGGTEAIDVAVHFDTDGDGTLTTADARNFQVSLDVGSPPYTLYRVTPTIAGGIVAEAIAPKVDNFVLRYYNRNGQPVVLDATGVEALATTALTAAERASVRSVEVELTLRTATEDPNLAASAWTDFAPGSAVTRDTAGAIDTGFPGFTDSHRRRKFTSRITPRSLAIGSCGRLELGATDPAPKCPDNTTITATVIDQFGAPTSGVSVAFSATAGTLSAGSGTTTAAGQASVDLDYGLLPPSLAKPVMVSAQADVSCTQDGATQTVTLHNSFVVNFQPGPWDYVVVAPPTTTSYNTCPGFSFDFSAAVFDECANPVPPDATMVFTATLAGGTSAAITDGGDLTSQVQTFTVSAPGMGPWGTTLADFTLAVAAGGAMPAGVATGGVPVAPASFSVGLNPWPPVTLWWNSTLPATGYEDCPSPAQSGTFFATDCFNNPVFAPFSTTATLTNDPGGPTGVGDQGTLAISAQTVSYLPPTCTLDPAATPAGITPTITLTGPATVVDPLTSSVTVQPCLDSCSVTASVGGIPITSLTECMTPADIDLEVSRCSLGGEPLRLVLTQTGGTAWLEDAAGNQSNAAGELDAILTGNNPSTANVTLHVQSAADGDIFTVATSYQDPSNPGAPYWQCNSLSLAVDNLCGTGTGGSGVKICSDPACTQDIVAGSNDCISNVGPVVYFEVDDCRYNTGALPASAFTVQLTGTGYSDLEEVVLTPDLSGARTVLRGQIDIFQLDAPVVGDGFLTYPGGETVTITADYEDPLNSTDTCSEWTDITGPLPLCFPNAITSGGGAGWRGNFDVHWGDVVVRGNISLPPHFIEKTPTGMFSGARYTSTYTDRFVDIYVGKSFAGDPASGNFTGVLNSTPSILDQPFIGSGYGNYFRNISYPKITDMIVQIDYAWIKQLAQDRGTYWYTIAGDDLRNPDHDALIALGVNASNLEFSLQDLLTLSAPGIEKYKTVVDGSGTSHNVLIHDGDFVFIDTYGTGSPIAAPTYTTAQVDALATSSMPTHVINGNFFTEGIIYVAGSIDFDGLGPRTTIPANTPPEYESHYDHNTATWLVDEYQLPILSDPTETQRAFNLAIHINGAFYADGEIGGNGNPSVYGSLTAERGYQGTGTPEIWYNYDLNVSGTDTGICVECCTIRVDPAAAVLEIGDTENLVVSNASGGVDWFSNADTIASVDTTGQVTAHSLGTASIGVRDHNNCVDFAKIDVVPACFGFAVEPSSASITVGQNQSFSTVNAKTGAAIGWSVDDAAAPGVVTVLSANPALPGSLVVTAADAPGNVWIQATDTAGICPSDALEANLHIRCPDINAYLDDTSIGLGTGTQGNLVPGADDPATLSLSTTWSSSNSAVATVDASGAVTSVGVGTATITAAVSSSCTYDAALEVIAPVCTLSVTPATASMGIGNTVALTASGALGTAPLTWSSSSDPTATVDTSGVVTGIALGNAVVTAEDQYGCTATALIEVQSCVLDIDPTSGSLAVGDTLNLEADTSDAVTWSSSDPAVVAISAGSAAANPTTVEALAPGSATITASTASCSGTAEVTVVCGLQASPDPALLGVGTTLALTTTGEIGSVVWSSAAPAVATVDGATGMASGVAPGRTTITATDGAGCSDLVRTEVRVCTLAVTPANANIDAGDTTTLSAVGAFGAATWTSDDTAVASVNSSGEVLGVGSGVAAITAEDSIGCSSAASVEVCGLSISGNPTQRFNASQVLTAVDYGGAATAITWTSSNDLALVVSPASGSATTTVIGQGPTARNKTVIITVVDESGCTASHTISVTN